VFRSRNACIRFVRIRAVIASDVPKTKIAPALLTTGVSRHSVRSTTGNGETWRIERTGRIVSVRATDGTLDRPRASVIRKTDLKTPFTVYEGQWPPVANRSDFCGTTRRLADVRARTWRISGRSTVGGTSRNGQRAA